MDAGGMISSSAGNFSFPYFDVAGNRNAMWTIGDQYYGPDGIDDIFMTDVDEDIMVPTSDPRLDMYFIPGEEAGGDFIGCPASQNATTESAFYNAANLAKPDQEDIMLSYSEQMLLEAEAEVRFNNDLITAKSKFDAGITASMNYWGVEAADIATFLAQFTFSDNTQALRLIQEQQWVDLIPRPIEGWTNWRRTGPKGSEVPALTVPVNANYPDLFRQWPLPTNETSANPYAPNPQPHIYDHMWFDL